MQPFTFLMAILAVSLLLLFSTPETEGTFIFVACLLRSPMCPWITTATTKKSDSASAGGSSGGSSGGTDGGGK